MRSGQDTNLLKREKLPRLRNFPSPKEHAGNNPRLLMDGENHHRFIARLTRHRAYAPD